MRNWLRLARIKKGVSMGDVATFAGISRTAYFYIETGRNNPKVKTAKLIADFLDCEWIDFYNFY